MLAGGSVPGYRLYDLDGAGKFSASEWIEADDDSVAVDAARALNKTCRCELWRGPKFIATISPVKPAVLAPIRGDP